MTTLGDLLQLELRSIDSALSLVQKMAGQVFASDPQISKLERYAARLSEARARVAAVQQLEGHPAPPEVVRRATTLGEEIHRLAVSGASVAVAMTVVSIVSQLDLYMQPLLGPKGPPIVDPDD